MDKIASVYHGTGKSIVTFGQYCKQNPTCTATVAGSTFAGGALHYSRKAHINSQHQIKLQEHQLSIDETNLVLDIYDRMRENKISRMGAENLLSRLDVDSGILEILDVQKPVGYSKPTSFASISIGPPPLPKTSPIEAFGTIVVGMGLFLIVMKIIHIIIGEEEEDENEEKQKRKGKKNNPADYF